MHEKNVAKDVKGYKQFFLWIFLGGLIGVQNTASADYLSGFFPKGFLR